MRPPLLFALLLSLSLAACSPTASVDLDVSAATSLTAAFREIGSAYEAEHPGVLVRLNFAGSQTLRTQIELGANPDLFAAAAARDVDAVEAVGHVIRRREFARNELVLVVAKDSAIASFDDLPATDRLVVGTAASPIGAYTDLFLDALPAAEAAALRSRVVSRESNVGQVLAKVSLGEADAAFVYATDALAHPDLCVVALPADWRPTAIYHLAQLDASAEVAELWRFIGSPAAQSILKHHGFGAVSP